jgi:hypothetical protein
MKILGTQLANLTGKSAPQYGPTDLNLMEPDEESRWCINNDDHLAAKRKERVHGCIPMITIYHNCLSVFILFRQDIYLCL